MRNHLVLGLCLLAFLATSVTAAVGDELAFQPAATEAGSWSHGTSIRFCATAPMTGSFDVAQPNGAHLTIAPDAEGCGSTVLNQDGPWSITWTKTGDTSRTISFTVYGGQGMQGWLELAFLATVFVVAWWRRWLLVMGVGALGVVLHLFAPDMPNQFPLVVAVLVLIAFIEYFFPSDANAT